MESTILVVDDDGDTLSMVRDALAGEGYRVLTAESGGAALGLAAKEPLDLIILDLMMPQMDGFDFLRALASSGLARGVRVIVLTALDSFAYPDDFLADLFGVCIFMYKPFQPGTLRQNVRQALLTPRKAAPAQPPAEDASPTP
jgi:DNA-binding response OmpR family regulator